MSMLRPILRVNDNAMDVDQVLRALKRAKRFNRQHRQAGGCSKIHRSRYTDQVLLGCVE